MHDASGVVRQKKRVGGKVQQVQGRPVHEERRVGIEAGAVSRHERTPKAGFAQCNESTGPGAAGAPPIEPQRAAFASVRR
jgi:hypothetical protein